jgi:hypothetical protein
MAHDIFVEPDTRECVVCQGILVVLGVLGRIVHLRCRNCGANHSHQKEG